MSIKQKVCSYYLGRKVVFREWILVVSVMSELAVTLFSVQKRWVHRCCCDVPRQEDPLSCRDVFDRRICLGRNCSVEEKLEFKRCEDVLEEVEKFCYLGDMISCFGGTSEVAC